MTEKQNDFAKWLASDEGRKCSEPFDARIGPYLENRLWWAFQAGTRAADVSRPAHMEDE